MAALASKQPGWGSLLGQIIPLMQNWASSGKLPKSPPYAQYSTVLPECMNRNWQSQANTCIGLRMNTGEEAARDCYTIRLTESCQTC